MVKAGVFLLARLWPVLSGTSWWFWLVGGTGALTLLLGAFIAMFQNDLKRLLAYSTISHLGLITLLFGLNSRSEEHTSELQSLMRISYAVFCLKKKKTNTRQHTNIRKMTL